MPHREINFEGLMSTFYVAYKSINRTFQPWGPSSAVTLIYWFICPVKSAHQSLEVDILYNSLVCAAALHTFSQPLTKNSPCFQLVGYQGVLHSLSDRWPSPQGCKHQAGPGTTHCLFSWDWTGTERVCGLSGKESKTGRCAGNEEAMKESAFYCSPCWGASLSPLIVEHVNERSVAHPVMW